MRSHAATRKVATVSRDQRDGLVEGLTLNQSAPFHIVEKESWMALPQRNLAASIEAPRVIPQFGNLLRRGVEVIASVECVVASKPPCTGVELFCSRLNNRGDAGR